MPVSDPHHVERRRHHSRRSIYTDSFRISIGTSFSSPIVAGTAALMLAARPTLSPVAGAVVPAGHDASVPHPAAASAVPACTRARSFDAAGEPVDQLECLLHHLDLRGRHGRRRRRRPRGAGRRAVGGCRGVLQCAIRPLLPHLATVRDRSARRRHRDPRVGAYRRDIPRLDNAGSGPVSGVPLLHSPGASAIRTSTAAATPNAKRPAAEQPGLVLEDGASCTWRCRAPAPARPAWSRSIGCSATARRQPPLHDRRAVRDQMAARGWMAEGDGPDRVVMCAPR